MNRRFPWADFGLENEENRLARRSTYQGFGHQVFDPQALGSPNGHFDFTKVTFGRFVLVPRARVLPLEWPLRLLSPTRRQRREMASQLFDQLFWYSESGIRSRPCDPCNIM